MSIINIQQLRELANGIWSKLDAKKVDRRPKKSFIIAVAGQSNAVGYDESPVSQYTGKNLNPNRIRQLGIYDNDNLQNIELGHHAHSFNDMRSISNPRTPTFKGTKGLHLPLGNLLLNEVPEDYEILFVSATYGGTGFTTGADGTYDTTTMKPSANARRWGVDKPFYLAMRDRVKYALDLNENNIFGGVIWVQGENDSASPTDHFTHFQDMTNAFFKYFNDNGYGKRVPKGTWDKDIWYNVETVAHWYNVDGINEIWNNYKSWNSKTYVHIPRNADSNSVNGTGGTSSKKGSHFGNDAYRKIVAPKILEKIKENNGLFNVNVVGFEFEQPLNDYSRYIVSNDVSGQGTSSDISLTDNMLSLSQAPVGYKSNIAFNSIYKLDFEVTKGIYWFAYRGDYNGIITVIALGGTHTHRVVDINLPSGTLKTIDTGNKYAYTLQRGDRISIYRNKDGTISFYIKKVSTGQYELWFNFNPHEYTGVQSINSSLMGFTFGYTRPEDMAGYDSKNLMLNARVQENQGLEKDPSMDKYIYNLSVNAIKDNSSIGDTPYTNASMPNVTTVSQALDEIIARLP